jgi:amino acid transporter
MSAPEAVKRLVIGRAFASHRLEHTLLPKIIALPVFSSDPLSSNAYATEEILLVLFAASAASLHLVMPIALAIALLMAIVITSYRQTVRAYPSGGGAYIVSKENLGTMPGLTAAAALLIDYVLTVSVSVSAGVLAISSAFPVVAEHAVVLSIIFVVLLTLANLRGVKEAGTLFAVPTYAFVASIFVMIVIGLARCAGGCPPAEPIEAAHDLARTAGPLSLFVILHAFSSGSTALTGVEAISNGVPAFRRPQAHNAARTLGVMGAMTICMFLGISWLATHVPGITVSHERSVVAQVAHAVFGGGYGFYLVQAFTAAILILAANTAYQDFPRLSSILARDGFMPSQFRNRGDRLVFSNGVIVLAVLAGALIYAFDANLSRLIQLYVVGVFTSFTLSQAGMVRHWMRERERGPHAARGWRRSIVINGIGAATTGVVLSVIAATKFVHGAWIVITAMPFIVVGLLGIRRHYLWADSQVRRGSVRPRADARNHVVLLVRHFDAAAAEALGYLRAIRPNSVDVVIPGTDPIDPETQQAWHMFAGNGVPDLQPLGDGGLLTGVRRFVRSVAVEPDGFVNVVVPEVVREGLLGYLVRHRDLIRLKAGLLRLPNVVVTDVPLVSTSDHPDDRDARPLIPNRVVALVFVSELNDATIRAVNYASTLHASETRAVYFHMDTEQEHRLGSAWFDSGLEVPLDIVEAPFRDLVRPMQDEVRRYTTRPGTVVSVVISERIVSRWWQIPLHNKSALFVKRLFLYEDDTILTSVPHQLAAAGQSQDPMKDGERSGV